MWRKLALSPNHKVNVYTSHPLTKSLHLCLFMHKHSKKTFSGLKLFACAENTKMHLQKLSCKGEERLVLVCSWTRLQGREAWTVLWLRMKLMLSWLTSVNLVWPRRSSQRTLTCWHLGAKRYLNSGGAFPAACMQHHMSVKN